LQDSSRNPKLAELGKSIDKSELLKNLHFARHSRNGKTVQEMKDMISQNFQDFLSQLKSEGRHPEAA
jgi:hypothetical protein